MKLACFGVLLFGLTSAQAQHVFDVINARSETEAYNMTILADGEEVLHVDLNIMEVVITLPDFIGYMNCSICLEGAKEQKQVLEKYFIASTVETKVIPVPPDVQLYPKDDVELGINNALVCFINNFFPPPVQVNWTKNNEYVNTGVTEGQYASNIDETFYLFATLTFDPQDGDIYTCTVDHMSLETPVTRIWEFDMPSNPSVVPDVACGMGVAVGLLLVIAGIFLFVEGRQFKSHAASPQPL